MIRFCFRLFVILFCTTSMVQAQVKKLNTFNIKNTSDLKEFFKYTPDRIPLICGHRGGAEKGFPENSIATLENTLNKMHAFFEIDPRLTKDSVIVILHDATLDRTTTGNGKLSDYTWEEVKQLKLKDPMGNVTEYRIHTLDEILQWSRNKTIIMIDKKDVPLPMILEAINRNKAESYVLVSSYHVEEAVFYHKNNKNIMFEAFIKNQKQFDDYEASGIPWSNIVAYFGQPRSKEFSDALHAKGVMTMIYTTPVMEKIKDKGERVQAYQTAIHTGGDILLSDRVAEVSDAIKPYIPLKSKKWSFFRKN